MYKQLNHSNHEAAYLLGSILLFSFQGCKEKPVTSLNLSSTPNVIYVFPDQMRNHAMGFWREARFRDAVNFEGDPVHTPNLDRFAKEFGHEQLPAEQSAPGNIVNGDVSGT